MKVRDRGIMHKVVKEIVDKAQKIGWRYVGLNGAGHHVLKHENGAEETLPATPSEYRGMQNALLTLERKAGQKLPRPKAGRSRAKVAKEVLDLEQAAKHNAAYHRQWGDQIVNLWTMHENDVMLMRQLAANPTRTSVQEAKESLGRIRKIEAELRRFGQPVKPFSITDVPAA
jgi:predicted RNA binding protein YcfA (HicA-like mRNA interferase family)